MIRMARKPKQPDDRPEKPKARMIRVDPELMPGLQVLRSQHLTSLTDEIRRAVIAALTAQGLWPWDEEKAERFRVIVEKLNQKDEVNASKGIRGKDDSAGQDK